MEGHFWLFKMSSVFFFFFFFFFEKKKNKAKKTKQKQKNKKQKNKRTNRFSCIKKQNISCIYSLRKIGNWKSIMR